MEGYEIYGKYSRKPHGRERVVSVLPSLFGPKVVEIPFYYPLEKVRELASKVAKQHKVNDHWLKPVACRKGKPYVD